MDERLELLYRLPGIKEYEDISLAVLYEYCGVLEEQLNTIMDNLPDDHRQIIEAYIDARNQLELQSIAASIRWGKQNPYL